MLSVYGRGRGTEKNIVYYPYLSELRNRKSGA